MRDVTFRKPTPKSGNRIRKKRDWKLIKRRCQIFLGCFLLAAAMGLGGWYGVSYLQKTGFFQLEKVAVENNQRVSQAEILSMGEVRPGMSLFEIDPGQIGRRIETLDWVKKASVERIFPRELRIQVEERVPVAVVKLDYFYYVDREGTLFKLLEAGDHLDFPVITGIDRERFLNDPEDSQKRLATALELLAELGTRRLFSAREVSEIHMDSREEFHLFTVHGALPIRIGNDLFGDKLDRLERVYGQLKPRLAALQGIDLNVPDQVIVRLHPQQVN